MPNRIAFEINRRSWPRLWAPLAGRFQRLVSQPQERTPPVGAAQQGLKLPSRIRRTMMVPMAARTWKEVLADQMVPAIAEEVDAFEAQMHLRKAGKLDEKVFAETRLRRGAYGQRYDNGRRNDGIKTQELRLSAKPADQGPRDDVGCAGDDADQDPVRRADPAADDRAGRAGRGIFRRHLPHHHPAGYPASLRPHRRHAVAHAAAGGGGHHHPRSLRQLRPQRHRLPAGRGVQYREI